MQRFGVIAVLVTLLIAGVAGVIGYNWGYSAGLANTAAANGASVIYGPGYGWGGGFGFFGLLFGVFFLFLIFGLIRAAFGGGRRGRHGGYGRGYGGWGKGPWGGDPRRQGPDAAAGVPPFVDGMLHDWHQKAHGDEATSADARSAQPSGGTPT